MKKKLKTIGSLAMMGLTALMVSCNTQTTDMEQQIDELYQKMPQEERIAQLKSMYMDELFDEQGKLDTAKCRELIPYGIGHFSQFCMQQPRDPHVLRDPVSQLSCTKRCSLESILWGRLSILSRLVRLDRSTQSWLNLKPARQVPNCARWEVSWLFRQW